MVRFVVFTIAPVAGSTVISVNFSAESKRRATVVSLEGVFANVFVVESGLGGTASDGYNELVSLSNLSNECKALVSSIQFNKSHD